MIVGFVVIGRNEGGRLEECLQSVLAVSDRIIYADSASRDGSDEVAVKRGINVVRLPDDGLLSAARGRNAGYQALSDRFPECDAVMFLDGDCILDPNFVTKAVEFLETHPEVGVACGRRFEAHPNASIYNRLCDAEWDTPVGEASECGGDALVRRTAFDEVGGYRSGLRAGEEPEMTARMRAAGWKIWRIDAPMTEHDAKIFSLGQWWRRTLRGGFGYAQVRQATRSLPQPLYEKQLRSAFAWAFGLPLATLVLTVALGRPWLLLLIPVAYALQILRIALGSSGPRRWVRAALIMLAKIPEGIGAALFTLGGAGRGLPEYKAMS